MLRRHRLLGRGAAPRRRRQPYIRPVSVAGAKAVAEVVAASPRRTSAETRLRVFAELAAAPSDDDGDGDGANGGAPTPPPAAATFVLDFYRAGQAPGLAAVLKGGKAADTAVLYRVARNVITHAWLAPDRDGLAEKGEAVGEAVGEAECLRGLQADRRDARCARRVLRRREAAGALLLQLIDCADMRSDMPPTVG